jgi:hypothetical protein
VPAAAVIPAPIAYIKVVAVKKLVVECGASVWVFLGCCAGGACQRVVFCAAVHCAHLAHWRASGSNAARCPTGMCISAGVTLVWCLLKHSYYCEKIRVFQAVIF